MAKLLNIIYIGIMEILFLSRPFGFLPVYHTMQISKPITGQLRNVDCSAVFLLVESLAVVWNFCCSIMGHCIGGLESRKATKWSWLIKTYSNEFTSSLWGSSSNPAQIEMAGKGLTLSSAEQLSRTTSKSLCTSGQSSTSPICQLKSKPK